MHERHNTDDVAAYPIENPNPVFRAAGDGTVLFANRASESLFAAWGTTRGLVLPLEWQREVASALASRERRRISARAGDRFFELDFVPIPERAYVNVYGRDVTEQERCAFQAKLLENVNDAIIAFDTDLLITAWNARAEEQYGWSAEEALGARAPDIVGSHTTEEARAAALQSIVETGRWQGEIQHTRRDGTPIIVEATSMALRDRSGRIYGHVTVNRDITERRQADLALRRQSERLEILHEIDRSILAAQAPAEIAQAAIARIGPVMDAQRLTVVAFDPATQTAEILAEAGAIAQGYHSGATLPLALYPMIDLVQTGQVAAIEDIAALPDSWPAKEATLRAGMRSATLVPLIAGEEVIGTLTISRAVTGGLAPTELALARQVADSLAVALYNARLAQQALLSREQLQNLSRQLVQVQETERSHVANELYNDEGQRLAAALIELGLLEKQVQADATLADRVAALKTRITDVLLDMHNLAVSLRPASLDRLGLAAAIRQFAEELGRQHGLALHLEMDQIRGAQLSPLTETMLYRIAQEALTNAIRHSQAGTVAVIATRQNDRLVIVIEDDGQGFEVAAATRSGRLGLLAMRERAEMIGGCLTIESAPEKGTTIYIEVPLAGA